MINTIRSCVLCRNKNSAEGINGVAFAFPYKEIAAYGDTSDQLKAMSLKTERRVFNDIFSIMAAQQKKAMEEGQSDDEAQPLLSGLFEETDYTKESWYVKGFEDYEQAEALVDIPLKETKDGYEIQLPKKLWKIIADCKTIAYMDAPDGTGEGMRYLGSDYVGGEDAAGNPMVTMDDNWVHIGGQLVCYEAEQPRETDEGTVFKGKVKARLNGKKDVILSVEWDPVTEDAAGMPEGHVVGYENASGDLLSSLMDTKGLLKLEAGDQIRFIFDTYDKEGNLLESRPEGKNVRVTNPNRLTVTDAPLESCDITFGGVLTDIYQRTMTTEMIEAHIGY